MADRIVQRGERLIYRIGAGVADIGLRHLGVVGRLATAVDVVVRYATRNGAGPCVIYLDRGERRAVAVIDAESVDVGAMRAAVTGGTVIDLTGDFDTGHDGGS